MNLQDISNSLSTPQLQALLLNDQQSSQSSSFYNPPYDSVTDVAANEQPANNPAMMQLPQPSPAIDEGTLLCQVLCYLLEHNKQQELTQMNNQEQMSIIPQQVQLTGGNHEDCDGLFNADILLSQFNSSRASVASSSSSSPLAFYSPPAVASSPSPTASLSFPSAPLSPDSNILPLTRSSSSSISTGAAIPSSTTATSSNSASPLMQKASFGYPTWLPMSSSHMEAISHNRQAAKDLLQSPAKPKHKRSVSETRTQPQVSAALLLQLLDEAKCESGIENGREEKTKHSR